MENKNTEEQLKEKAAKAGSIAMMINKAIAALFGTIGAFWGIIVIFIIVLASSIFLLMSVLFNGNDPNNPPSMEDAQTEITNACKADVNSTISWMRDIYMEKSIDASNSLKEYAIEKLGDQAESLPNPNEGFIGALKDLFGIDKGGTDLTLKDWQYIGYNDSNMVDMHFSKSYAEIGQTLYGYISANISALDNYENAYKSSEECEDGCTYEDLIKDDYDLECENTEEGCSIDDIISSMQSDKKETIKDVLSEQNNAENKDKVFYIDTTFSKWEDDLEYGEFEVSVTKTGSCTVLSPNADCPNSDKLDGYYVTSVEENTPDPGEPTNTSGKSYTVNYTYTEKEIREGVIGDVYVPIYINKDEFLKDKKEEIIDLMTKDLTMTEAEAYEELNSYINGSFEASMKNCGFDIDYELFGSTSLIGVGNNGAFGSIGVGDFSIYQGYDPFDPILNAMVWGEAFKFIDEGKINALKSYQCTTFVHWMFYKVYGFDCALGNGNQMAQNLVAKMPDKFQASSEPAPGAIASVGLDSKYGHVLFIHSVFDDDGDGKWDRVIASDGNLDGVQDTGNDGVRIMYEWTRSEWVSRWNPTYYAVPIS